MSDSNLLKISISVLNSSHDFDISGGSTTNQTCYSLLPTGSVTSEKSCQTQPDGWDDQWHIHRHGQSFPNIPHVWWKRICVHIHWHPLKHRIISPQWQADCGHSFLLKQRWEFCFEGPKNPRLLFCTTEDKEVSVCLWKNKLKIKKCHFPICFLYVSHVFPLKITTNLGGFARWAPRPSASAKVAFSDVAPWGVQPDNGDSSWINSGLMDLLFGYLWHSSFLDGAINILHSLLDGAINILYSLRVWQPFFSGCWGYSLGLFSTHGMASPATLQAMQDSPVEEPSPGLTSKDVTACDAHMAMLHMAMMQVVVVRQFHTHGIRPFGGQGESHEGGLQRCPRSMCRAPAAKGPVPPLLQSTLGKMIICRTQKKIHSYIKVPIKRNV